MKIKLKFGFLTAILLVSVLSFNLLAATPGLQYLKLPVFATSEAMGGAYTALPGDAPAVFYNPAGISLGEREYFSFSAGQNNWIEEVCKRSFVFVLPSHILTNTYIRGLSFDQFDSGSMEKINASGKEWGSFDYKESAVGLILGGMFNEFSMGAHLRFLMGTMGDYKGSGFSMDLGSIFQLADFLNFGLALNNLGGYKLEDISVDLPFTVRAGVGVVLETFDSDYKFGLDLENDSVGTFYRFGGEYINHEGFRLRAGINTVESGFQYSLGTGFSTPETRWGGIFNLNYSFTGGGELGEYIHRFDVGLNYIPDFY